jgi:hypothetical protein
VVAKYVNSVSYYYSFELTIHRTDVAYVDAGFIHSKEGSACGCARGCRARGLPYVVNGASTG